MMKSSFTIHYFMSSGITLVTLVLFCSCSVYHFEKPQPADAGNIYVFPVESLGTWGDDKGETVITITKNSMTVLGFDSIEVFNSLSTQKQDSSWKRKIFLKSIRLNKETKQLDTVFNFIIKGDKIYEIKENGLGAGYAFATKNNKISFRRDIIIDFELNHKAFLRKLTDHRYILNLHEENLWPLMEGGTGVGPWWQVVLLELTPDHKINIRTLDEKVKQNTSLIYTSESDSYFDVAWAKLKLNELTDQGLFEKSEPLHRISKPAGIKKK